MLLGYFGTVLGLLFAVAFKFFRLPFRNERFWAVALGALAIRRPRLGFSVFSRLSLSFHFFVNGFLFRGLSFVFVPCSSHLNRI